MQHSPDTAGALAGLFAGTFLLIWSLVVLAMVVLGIVVNWRIAVKAGYSGPLSLLMLIPLVNFIILLVFAFSEWPIEEQLKNRSGPAAAWQPPMT